MTVEQARIVRLAASESPPRLLAQIDAIFLETSARPPPPGPEREAFRERWLGRFMRGGTDVVLLALAGEDTVAGYLVGALDDPAPQERFADIGYFRAHFADLTRRFPAHLHVNLAERFRSRGIGASGSWFLLRVARPACTWSRAGVCATCASISAADSSSAHACRGTTARPFSSAGCCRQTKRPIRTWSNRADPTARI